MSVMRWSPRALGTFSALTLASGALGCAETSPPDAIGRVRNPGTVLVEDADIGVSASPPRRQAPAEHEDDDRSAIFLFHDVLSPYGAWRDDPRLGLVWSPSATAVSTDFVPYASHGRWTYREVSHAPEWTWVSDLPWGWVTFHYGRWAYAGDQGWAWIPGRKYAGAWVDWRVPSAGGPAIGWGPRPPAFLWRVSPLRTAWHGTLDPRDAYLETMPYAAFATPYVYAPVAKVFAPDLAGVLLAADAALAIAHATTPADAPHAETLGLAASEIAAPPAMDRGLLQAWMLATPANAAAVGAGPRLSTAPRLRTWVAGGASARSAAR